MSVNTILKIDHRAYLLPIDKATQVLKIMSGALEVEEKYDYSGHDSGYTYIVRNRAVRLEMTTLDKKAKIVSEGGDSLAATPKVRKPKRLGNGFLKLGDGS